jgi:hypothetical protein
MDRERLVGAHATDTAPFGTIVPPVPADASIVYGPFRLNVAAIVCVPWTLTKV